MTTKFKVIVGVHIQPGCTPDQSKISPGLLTDLIEKDIWAALETEAQDLALDEIINEVTIPIEDIESYSFSCKVVRLFPLRELDSDMADALRRKYAQVPLRAKPPEDETSCARCEGFGFVSDLHQDFLLCRCSECNRFETEEDMFQFMFAKLTAEPSKELPPSGGNSSGS